MKDARRLTRNEEKQPSVFFCALCPSFAPLCLVAYPPSIQTTSSSMQQRAAGAPPLL